MALTTYDDLKAAVASWLARSDLTSQIPDFITLAEKQILRRLGTAHRETSVTFTTAAGGTYSLPSDFARTRFVLYNATPVKVLRSIDPEGGNAFWSSSSLPMGYAIIGSTLYVYPAQAASLTLWYYQKFTALSSGNQTNWLITDAPDVYLFGTLVESLMYVQDDRAELWKARFEEALRELSEQEQQAGQQSGAYRMLEAVA